MKDNSSGITAAHSKRQTYRENYTQRTRHVAEYTSVAFHRYDYMYILVIVLNVIAKHEKVLHPEK